MATISSMASNTYTMYKMAQSKGMSLFSSDSGTAGTAPGLLSGLNSSSSNATSASIGRMWSNYAASTSASAASGINTLASVRSSLGEVISSYDSDKSKFYAKYDAAMSDLSGTAAKLSKTDFDIGAAKDPGTGEVTYDADKQKAVVKNVTDFVNAYNDSLSVLSDNADISTRADALSKRFADTTAVHAGTYAKYGITVNEATGKLSVNADKLTSALTKDPETTAYVLGKDLAGRASDNAALATTQRDSIYPSLSSALGDTIEKASVYTGGTITKMTALNNVGNLLNMFS